MPTISQLIRKPRHPKTYREKARHLGACPQKRGVCTRVYTTTPKKPNSALRKVSSSVIVINHLSECSFVLFSFTEGLIERCNWTLPGINIC